MPGRQIDPVAAERAERKVISAQRGYLAATGVAERKQAQFWAAVLDGFEQGITYVRMAEILQVSDVTVYNIIKKARGLIRGGRRSA